MSLSWNRAMASQMARDILNVLADGAKTQSEISDRLEIPVNTITYHINNLVDSGLVNVSDTKHYSVKGREVK